MTDQPTGGRLSGAVEIDLAAPTPPSADTLVVRWQHLGEDGQEQVIDNLARRHPAALAAALDLEERTRPDAD